MSDNSIVFGENIRILDFQYAWGPRTKELKNLAFYSIDTPFDTSIADEV